MFYLPADTAQQFLKKRILLFINKSICLFGSKIGEEQSSEDAEDGPPELLVCSALFVAVTQLHVQGCS